MTATQSLQETLTILENSKLLLSEYEQRDDPKKLVEASYSLHEAALKLRMLSKEPESHSKSNLPLLTKLAEDTMNTVRRMKILASGITAESDRVFKRSASHNALACLPQPHDVIDTTFEPSSSDAKINAAALFSLIVENQQVCVTPLDQAPQIDD